MQDPTSALENADFSFCDTVLAKRHGVTLAQVRYYRMIHRIPIGKKGKRSGLWMREHAADPSKMDFSKRDTALSAEFGVSRERIRQLRKAQGLPPSPRRRWFCDDWDWHLPNKALAAKMGLPVYSIIRLRKKYGPPTVPGGPGTNRGLAYLPHWKDYDFQGKTLEMVMSETGCSWPVASKARQLWAPETIHRRKHRKRPLAEDAKAIKRWAWRMDLNNEPSAVQSLS